MWQNDSLWWLSCHSHDFSKRMNIWENVWMDSWFSSFIKNHKYYRKRNKYIIYDRKCFVGENTWRDTLLPVKTNLILSHELAISDVTLTTCGPTLNFIPLVHPSCTIVLSVKSDELGWLSFWVIYYCTLARTKVNETKENYANTVS